MCCISHEQTRSCGVNPREVSQGRTWWQSLQPAHFSLKTPFVQWCLTSPSLLCSLLLACHRESGFFTGQGFGTCLPVWEADLEDLFFEGSSFCGRCWRFIGGQQEQWGDRVLPCVWDGAVGGEEERRQQEKARIRGKWIWALPATVWMRACKKETGFGQVEGEIWMSEGVISFQKPLGDGRPCSHPWGQCTPQKAWSEAEVKSRVPLPQPSKREARGSPAALLAPKDRKSSKMRENFLANWTCGWRTARHWKACAVKGFDLQPLCPARSPQRSGDRWRGGDAQGGRSGAVQLPAHLLLPFLPFSSPLSFLCLQHWANPGQSCQELSSTGLEEQRGNLKLLLQVWEGQLKPREQGRGENQGWGRSSLSCEPGGAWETPELLSGMSKGVLKDTQWEQVLEMGACKVCMEIHIYH